ncbi:uncharacterized protein LOC110826730 isoform X2 [Zootermopsis nevadensis]|uniref:uncharacterized protein LOC110826730 isoform X2 n=1 Tax=Zootermopsis nevadensis TaxID=136037 RepID=UPI000B8EDA37|nr:uncharacterized protein LOC110826730 isoform X2 [Zootermopsis nevadensis]
MRKVLKFVKGKRDEKKEHGSSGRALGPFFDLPSPTDQSTPTDDHSTGFEQSFGYNVDISGKDKSITKLHKAAWQGNLEKLKVNMKKTDMNVVDKLNRTPLHLAAAQGYANVVWFLLGKKANFNICDNEGKTPFLKAIECGHKEVIQLMLERGVDINTIDYSGNSGLHIAAKQGFYEIASMLLKQGANFESSNNFGEFPLHIATVAEHKDLVELLLRYGSSVNIVDRDNRSPLMFAAKCGSMALVHLFLEYGAQCAVMDSNDLTAEDYALKEGHHDIAAELKSPSDRMVMSFNEEIVESEKCDTAVTPTRRSVSDASLLSDRHEGERENINVADKQNEEADNSDTWNDSQLSDSSLKQKGAGLKISKFLPPSSDDEISEESIHSPRVQEVKDEDGQDSPRSCVIPPPCKPPRSWDLIQSGVIDDPKVLEPRRRSLLPLGSLKSRRESFNESPTAAESPSFHGDSLHIGQGDADALISIRKNDDKRDSLTHHHLNVSSECEGNKDSPSTKYEDIQVKESSTRLHKRKEEGSALMSVGGEAVLDDIRSSKESLKGSSSNSDWDSDDSLPLDNYPATNVTISPADTNDSPLKVFRVINPSELVIPDTTDDPTDGSPYSLNAERRSRFLTRAPSIDLTDDDTETGKNKVGQSPEASELGRHRSDTRDDNEIDVNSSVSGTLGRDGTLLGYEEVWESNARIPKSSITLSGPSCGADDTCITIKEELEETLVWSSPQFDGNIKGLTSTERSKDVPENWNSAEDTLLYPSPQFDKARGVAVSENNVHIKYIQEQTSMCDVDRISNSLKLESDSLDALGPQKCAADGKIPHTRKHARQQSVSVQSWSRSDEIHEKPAAAHVDRMVEENQHISAQLRCYDEALRDLAHVSVVRKQSSLSLPRAKETSGLPRSQSAGSRNDGFLLPSANDFGPREMAQSAIVKKQGSLSLPRTTEIPDFAMVQSLGPRKQGHSSLPCANEFGVREMAQTAIVKRQGSLSLPRTCEIPDFTSANEEYLSLPRSNELIDEAFKEIGQSSVTMKRGSRSLPRSVDAKLISFYADPVAPPRHKKSSHRRRRAESEGEGSDRSMRDAVSKSLSFDVKTQLFNGTEQTAPILKPSLESEVMEASVPSPNAYEKPCSESTSGDVTIKEIGLEKPIRKKRKMLLEMRGFLGPDLKNVSGGTVSELSVEDSFEEHPFWMSTDKGGPLGRQETVIERSGFSVKGESSATLSPAKLDMLECEKKQESDQTPVRELTEILNSTQPSDSSSADVPLLEETSSFHETDENLPPEGLQKGSPENQRNSQSDDIESEPSHSDNTPQHIYLLKGNHNLLKQHLQKATAEKGLWEETAAELGERAEKLKYDLAEACEATRSRDEVIALLEDQLSNVETMYTKSREESQRYKLRLGNLEQELKHLKEVCGKLEDEKSHLTEIIRLKEMEIITLSKSLAAKDEKIRLQGMVGDKEKEEEKQKLEIHINCLEIEKSTLQEEVCRLHTRNEDLRQKLHEVVTRNQLLSDENVAMCIRKSLDVNTLQEHSEKWTQLYEACLEKLQLISSCIPSTEGEPSLPETGDFRGEVQQIIQRLEETKQEGYVIWKNKIQEEIMNSVCFLKAEYSRIGSSLLKDNEKLELVTNRLLESFSKHGLHDEHDKETCATYTAVNLVEELALLYTQFREKYMEIETELYLRLGDLERKLEAVNTSLDTGRAKELWKENMLPTEQSSKVLWCELKDENATLQRETDLLEEHVKDVEHVVNKESIREADTGTMEPSGELFMENLKLKQYVILPADDIKESSVMEQGTMTEPVEYELPEQYKDLLNKLRIENVKLQDQIHLFEVHLKAKEAVEDTDVMTDSQKLEEEQKYKDENTKLEAGMLFLQNNITQHSKDFGRDDGGASRYISDPCTAVSGTCSPSRMLLDEDQSLQEATDDKLTDQRIVAVENLLAENGDLRRQLESVRLELEEFNTRTMIHDVRPLKTGINNVQTMTDPDVELVHVSMENVALQAQLQQVSKECKKKGVELERMSVLIKESREASGLQLKEALDTHAHENTLLMKELEEMKRQIEHQQHATKESQLFKITEICNLLDHLRKENIVLKAQLTEKEDKEKGEYDCHNLHQNQEVSKDHSVGNIDDRVASNVNLDSLAHFLSVGCSVSLEEAKQRRTVGMKASNIEVMDTGIHSQSGNVFTFSNVAAANQDEPASSVRTNDRHESELSFSDISAMTRVKQHSPNAEQKCQIPINANRKEQELQNIDSTKSQIGKHFGPLVHCRCIGSDKDETGCCMLKNSQDASLFCNGKMASGDVPSDFLTEQAEGDCVTMLPVTSAEGSDVTVKHQRMYKDNNSSSSEIFLNLKQCQTQMSCCLSSESTNSDLGSINQERANKAKFRPCRDAATNTTPSIQNLELQRELQLEKDRCRKYQQNIRKLKSDIQLLKNKLGESRKQGKIEPNSALKQNNTNNNSLMTDLQSPTHFDSNMAEFQRQVADLEQKVQEENAMRFSLEVQVNKMRYELEEKLQLEKELGILRSRLEKDFVSRYELEQLRNSYELALSHAKHEAEMSAHDDLNEKLGQINTFIEKQVQEQTRLSQLRNTTESQMKQEFQETRLKLLSELAKVQASLQAKGEEEKELREKCEKLTRECEKKHEVRRKKLIEKTYNVNLAPYSSLKEKELSAKTYVLDMKSPMQKSSPVQPSSPATAVTTHVADAWQTEHPFSHILRRELERSIRKHSHTEHPSGSSPQTASEEHLELLKKKYFLH